MVFDKTGTLTEEGLTVFGFRSAFRAVPEDSDMTSVVLFTEFK